MEHPTLSHRIGGCKQNCGATASCKSARQHSSLAGGGDAHAKLQKLHNPLE